MSAYTSTISRYHSEIACLAMAKKVVKVEFAEGSASPFVRLILDWIGGRAQNLDRDTPEPQYPGPKAHDTSILVLYLCPVLVSISISLEL